MIELSAKELNEQIVGMRKLVSKSLVRVYRRLDRGRQKLLKSVSEKKKRKATRLLDELKALKELKRDEVSKFALLNTKTLAELSAQGTASAAERATFKLIVDECLSKGVAEFRTKYPNWRHEVPFLLQRLGLQYRSRKRSAASIHLDSDGTLDAEDQPKAEECKKKRTLSSSSSEKVNPTTVVSSLVNKEIQNSTSARKLALKKKENNKVKSTKRAVGKDENLLAEAGHLPSIELPTFMQKGQMVIQRLDLKTPCEPHESEGGECAELKSFEQLSSSECRPSGSSSSTGGDSEMESSAENCGTVEMRSVKEQHSSDKKRIVRERNEARRTVRKGKRKASEGEERTSRQGQFTKDEIAEEPTIEGKLVEGGADEQQLHPSWIAKRRQKQQMAEARLKNIPTRKIFIGDDDGDDD